ncbi:hypothetical protein PHYSODRAFT_523007 [Phytophthora sojae]|uniref:Transmembrane protein n=1 Tax=Phytophthora sojae (strain P6497) TaxID=1094619 RepID=G5A520_PHYSP|nr:hypothetical protein PHYSODRAFT_523007 [Phytophthora sojae]EGZ09769.1 hypothetical protein PHYSODRAFT_523007 [Phytophthora sojae]|eukprot:XP_009534630.1 hypothetical protein PHYSODRAFT_523007 [Phytophthora sojae]
MRVEYMKVLARRFDFCFTQLANMLWAITLSVVLMDLRVTMVLVYSLYFTNSLFQEANLRHSTFMTLVALGELAFCLLLMVWLSLGLIDDVHHHVLLVASGRTLSTKDVLVNALDTMAMLSLRHTYRRYIHSVHQKNNPGASMRAQGKTKVLRPLLQMYLISGYADIDPLKTIWPRFGAITHVSTWKSIVLYSCGVIGAGFAALSLFLPSNSSGTAALAVSGLVMSSLFSGAHLCCSQRHLLKSIVTSFNYLFLMFQVVATGVCVVDMLTWHWVSACGVLSSWVLAHTVLTADALTPIMKHRLRFKYWLVIGGIVLFWLIHAGLLLDVLVLGNLNLQDRVFLDFIVLGQHCQFRVAPFLLSRVVTLLVWAARYVVAALTGNNNALVLLRGTVAFDYESWKKEAANRTSIISRTPSTFVRRVIFVLNQIREGIMTSKLELEEVLAWLDESPEL